MSRCTLAHLAGLAGGFVGGAAGGVTVVDKLVALNMIPGDPVVQAAGLLLAGVAAGVAGAIAIAASMGCYRDGYS